MIELRPYQRDIVNKALSILRQKYVVYLACEVRTGKTPMSLTVAKEMGWKKVAFITKKNAIEGIEKFSIHFKSMYIKVTNYEQVNKLEDVFDGYIIDESHNCGTFPKPSNRAKLLKALINFKPVILLSGTPSPETPSQLFHQFWITGYGPWKEYNNFYKWAKDYVDKRTKFIRGIEFNDYSKAKTEKVTEACRDYMVNLSQQQAGFTSYVEEQIVYVTIDKRMYQLMDHLKKNKFYKMKSGEVILADSPVKLQSVCHQISSGTIKIDNKYHTLDESKAWFIKAKFYDKKIAIFYKFIQEGEVLRKVFPNHTDNPDVFNKSKDIVFIKQCVSGREGVDLSSADLLIAYNIDFSATTYWQMRARMQTLERTKESKLVWIFSENGIENFVHRAVTRKKKYTSDYFMKDIESWSPNFNARLSLT